MLDIVTDTERFQRIFLCRYNAGIPLYGRSQAALLYLQAFQDDMQSEDMWDREYNGDCYARKITLRGPSSGKYILTVQTAENAVAPVFATGIRSAFEFMIYACQYD